MTGTSGGGAALLLNFPSLTAGSIYQNQSFITYPCSASQSIDYNTGSANTTAYLEVTGFEDNL
jgi:hypothetical protein